MDSIFLRSKRSFLMCCVYRPPSKADFFISECEKSLCNVNKKLLLIGDFNSDLLHPTLPQSR